VTVHIAGAGLAGLAAAVTAVRAGHKVVVHEAAGLAGGRCRSFFDPTLERVIDNGTHVVLGANRAALGFLDEIGATEAMAPAASAVIPFIDLECGTTWSVDVAGHGIPTLMKAVPSIRARAGLVRAAMSGHLRPGATVAAVYGGLDGVYERLIVPLSTAVMNCAPEEAPASLFGRLVGVLTGGGRGAFRPFVARTSLAEAFILPALRAIEERGGEVRFHDPLTEIEAADHVVRAGIFRSGAFPLGPGDALVLALPPWALGGLLPQADLPPAYRSRAIICAHFALEYPLEMAGAARLTGCINAMAQWFAATDGVLSVTVSAADHWMTHEADELAALLWRDASTAFRLPAAPIPSHRVIKERRATAEITGGFGPGCKISKLFFAGGWTSARYPDTIEAAVASGIRAARCLGSPERCGQPHE
jgi:hypothetical protein